MQTTETVTFDKRDVWQHSLSAEERKAGLKPREELLSAMPIGGLLQVFRECCKRIKEKRDSEALFTAKLETVIHLLGKKKVKIPKVDWEEVYQKIPAVYIHSSITKFSDAELLNEVKRRNINFKEKQHVY